MQRLFRIASIALLGLGVAVSATPRKATAEPRREASLHSESRRKAVKVKSSSETNRRHARPYSRARRKNPSARNRRGKS